MALPPPEPPAVPPWDPASDAKNPSRTALDCLFLGLWPVPITPPDDPGPSPGKRPLGGKGWGKTRPTAGSLQEVYRKHPGAGVGLKLGAEGGVIDLDVDDPELAAPVLARLFPDGMPATVGWTSAKGRHLLFRYHPRLAAYGKSIIKGALGRNGKVVGNPHYLGLELRIGADPDANDQLQSVIPPSIGTDGQPRRWNGCREILELPESVFMDLDWHARPPEREEAPASPAPPTPAAADRPQGKWTPEARAAAYLQKCDPAVSGQGGHDQAFKTACKVGPGFDLPPDVALRLIREVWNPTCVPPWSEAELRHKVDEAYKVEPARGGLLNADRGGGNPRPNGARRHPAGDPLAEEDELPTDDDVIMICLADVVTEPIRWLIPNVIARGMLTLIAGDQKVGKGFVTMDLAARVTTGAEIPGSGGECVPQGSVVLLTAEEGLSRIVRPRIVAADGDPSKVHELKAIRLRDGTVRPFDLKYLRHLERGIGRFGDTRILIIDPISQYLPDGTDDHKSVQLRMVLGPLIEMAERLDVAILLIHHLTKGNGTKGLYRVSGSGAYTQICRSNWLVCKDPKDKSRRLFLSMGTNLGPEPTGLAFHIDRETMRVVWSPEPLEMSADDALRNERDEVAAQRGESPSKVAQCIQWLEEVFRPGRTVSSDEILTEGEAKGFGRALVFEAKKSLTWIHARKEGYQGAWVWCSDPQPPKSPGDPAPDSLDGPAF
jgi:hypothetical protein